jgi:hypothetical protein
MWMDAKKKTLNTFKIMFHSLANFMLDLIIWGGHDAKSIILWVQKAMICSNFFKWFEINK